MESEWKWNNYRKYQILKPTVHVIWISNNIESNVEAKNYWGLATHNDPIDSHYKDWGEVQKVSNYVSDNNILSSNSLRSKVFKNPAAEWDISRAFAKWESNLLWEYIPRKSVKHNVICILKMGKTFLDMPKSFNPISPQKLINKDSSIIDWSFYLLHSLTEREV